MTDKQKQWLEIALTLIAFGCVVALALLVSGCLNSKASHQNGVVCYVSTSGQIGIGYGECEDLPAGCKFRREVEQCSPAFWSNGTNYTRTVTEWDTTAMVTNRCDCNSLSHITSPE